MRGGPLARKHHLPASQRVPWARAPTSIMAHLSCSTDFFSREARGAEAAKAAVQASVAAATQGAPAAAAAAAPLAVAALTCRGGKLRTA